MTALYRTTATKSDSKVELTSRWTSLTVNVDVFGALHGVKLIYFW